MKSKPIQQSRLRFAVSCALAWVFFALAAHSQALNPGQSSTNGPAYMPGELLIKFKDGATEAQVQDVARRAGVSSFRHIQTRAMKDRGNKGITHAVTPQPVELALQELKKHPGVDYAQPNWIYRHQAVVNDPSYLNGSLWGLYGANTSPANSYGIDAEAGWDGVSSPTVYVGIIDEGIQYNHPDLAANIWTNPGEISNDALDNDGNGYINDIYGWNAINNNGTIYSATYDDHGTHVAGTIGAVANNGAGVVGVTGNRSARFISGKFLGPNGGTTADAIEIIDYMIALKTHNGLNLVALNNSWGGGGYDTALFNAIVRAADADILFVVAAGNDGINTDATPAYPACYDTTAASTKHYNSVISVTAIDKSGALASFANYGATTIALGAPGVEILSTLNRSGYGAYSGTSMATPHVTGAIALYKSKYPDATAAEIRTALLNSTTPTPSLAGKTTTGGRLNVDTFLLPPATTAPTAPSGLALTDVAATGITLNWTDTSDNETNFRITRSDIISGTTVISVGANTTSHTDTGLVPETTYTYAIEACNGIGCTPQPATDPIAEVTTPAIARAVATFKRIDTTTKGNWVGNYGVQAYDTLAYKNLTPDLGIASTGLINVWATTTTDLRGLQSPDKSSRTARCYYSPPPNGLGSSFTLDVNLKDNQSHRVSLYFLDWDSTATTGWRGQRIEIIDHNYQTVIPEATIDLPYTGFSSFRDGQYLVWEISGHVTIKITNTSAANSVVSGIFIDDPNFVPPTPPSAPSGLGAAAISRSQINLTWTDTSSNETGFAIERSKSATTGFSQIATVGAGVTTYPSTGLSRNTTYYYRVRSYNAAGYSAYSTTTSAKTLSK